MLRLTTEKAALNDRAFFNDERCEFVSRGLAKMRARALMYVGKAAIS
jgi:hypothetical protein